MLPTADGPIPATKNERPVSAPWPFGRELAFVAASIVLFALALLGTGWYGGRMAGFYPVRGAIVDAPFERMPNELPGEALGDITYKYVVAGRPYLASRPVEEWQRARRSSAMQQWHRGRPARADSLIVWVSTTDPSRSRLDSAGRWPSWILVGLVVCFALVVTAVMALIKAIWMGNAPTAMRNSPAVKDRYRNLSGMAVVVIATIFGWVGGVGRLIELRSLAAVDGIIDDVSVLPISARKGTTNYAPALRFSYVVDGNRYQSTRVSNTHIEKTSEAAARAPVAGLTVGSRVTVYVPRGKPHDGFVVKRMSETYMLLGFGAMGTIILVATARRTRGLIRSSLQDFSAGRPVRESKGPSM